MKHLKIYDNMTDYDTASDNLPITHVAKIEDTGEVIGYPNEEMVAVEYLQSDGNSWIDTNIPYDSTKLTYKIECKFSMPSYVSSYDAIFGAYTSENDKCLRIIRGANDSKMWLYYNSKANGGVQATFSTANSNIKEIIITSTSASLTELGTTTNYTYSTYSGNNTTSKFYLFAQGIVNGSISCKSKSRIYYWKIYDNDVLIHYLVPVRLGNVGYMFDKVSKRLFGNAGTGNFILGPDIIPVEYLQGVTGAYIDTGLTINSTNWKKIKMYFVGSFVNVSNNKWRAMGIGATHPKYHFGINGSNYLCYGNGGSSDVQTTRVLTQNEYTSKHIYVLDYPNSKLYFDNETFNMSLATSTTLDANIHLFTWNANGYSGQNFCEGGKLYSFRIYNNTGGYERNFVPVRIGTTGYLLDKVEWKLYANAGTGSFTYGNDLQSTRIFTAKHF